MTDTVKATKVPKFIVKMWDGDIYILEGYNSAEELDARLSLAEKVKMPNGDIRKTADIKAVVSQESYEFQADQKDRHKRGQYLIGESWYDIGGEVGRAHGLKSITGTVDLPQLQSPQSQQKRLSTERQ